MEKSLFEQMGGTYSKVGDYSLPNLLLPQEETKPIGLWGQRHARYLKRSHKVLYIIKYSLRRATINYISSQNLGVRFYAVHACGMRKGNTAASEAALNCRRAESVKDSFDFGFQSRLHECETNTSKG